MTFTQYLALLPSHWSTNEKLQYTQNAYYEVVNKLRLFPSVHPVVFDESCDIGGFNNLITINDSDSVLAFKEVIALPNAILVSEFTDEATVDTPYTGNLLEVGTSYLGYEEATYDAFNDEWDVVPIIFNIGTRYVSTNIEGTTCLYVAGYVYPYFLYTDNGPYVDYHCYDIVTDYEDYLDYNVSDTLLPLVMMKAKAFYYNDHIDMAKENTLNKMVLDCINIYNMSNETIAVDSTQMIGLVDPLEVE